jgi:hypothetical protein
MASLRSKISSIPPQQQQQHQQHQQQQVVGSPKIGKAGIRKLHRSTQKQNRILPLALGIIAIVSWASVLVSWMQTSLSVAPPKKSSSASVQQVAEKGLPAREIELFPDNLQHEAFYETLSSCLPSESTEEKKEQDTSNGKKKNKKNCNLYVPDNGIERIAILSPPGAIGYVFEKFIDEVVRLHKTPDQKMEFIKTPHSLPYGYGKTHGYTKVIRLATLPLRLAAADLVLEQQHREGSSPDDVTMPDIVQATQQLVRWHCRVSHVAAHTAVLTVSLEDLLDDPWEEEYQIRSFLNLSPEQAEEHVDEDELAGSMDQIVHRSTLMLMKLDQLNHANGKHPTKMEDMLDGIVNEELKSTNNLDAWPCTSFWKFNHITPISRKTAALFAPNCTAPYTKCFVPRDYCEEKGDVKCAAKQK